MRIEGDARGVASHIVKLPQSSIAPVAVVRRDVLYLFRSALCGGWLSPEREYNALRLTALVVVPPRTYTLCAARQWQCKLDLLEW